MKLKFKLNSTISNILVFGALVLPLLANAVILPTEHSDLDFAGEYTDWNTTILDMDGYSSGFEDLCRHFKIENYHSSRKIRSIVFDFIVAETQTSKIYYSISIPPTLDITQDSNHTGSCSFKDEETTHDWMGFPQAKYEVKIVISFILGQIDKIEYLRSRASYPFVWIKDKEHFICTRGEPKPFPR